MRENLASTQEIFAKANSFEDLANFLTPSLREHFNKINGNDQKGRAFLSLYHLAVLRKCIFSFEEYKFQTWIEDGKSFLKNKKVENMLNAITNVGIIYGDKKGRYFIKRRLYRKLSRLTEAYEQKELAELSII